MTAEFAFNVRWPFCTATANRRFSLWSAKPCERFSELSAFLSEFWIPFAIRRRYGKRRRAFALQRYDIENRMVEEDEVVGGSSTSG